MCPRGYGRSRGLAKTISGKYRIFCDFRQKRVNNLLKKVDIYQYYDRNGTKLRSIYRIALLTETNFERAAQLERNKF